MNQSEIHPSAIVHPDARLGPGCTVGPFAVIEQGTELGAGCEIQPHAIIHRFSKLGERVRVFPFAVVGAEPQHLQFEGEESTVRVGSDTVIRESVTIHRGTKVGTGETVVGAGCFLMAYVHVAHDCIVGDGVIMANGVQMAGHSEIQDNAVIGGLSGITQFSRVGRYCYVGSGSQIRKDLPPFMTGKGVDFSVQSVNAVGMARKGFTPEQVRSVKSLYKIFYRKKLTVSRALEQISTDLPLGPEVELFVDFVKSSKVGVIR